MEDKIRELALVNYHKEPTDVQNANYAKFLDRVRSTFLGWGDHLTPDITFVQIDLGVPRTVDVSSSADAGVDTYEHLGWKNIQRFVDAGFVLGESVFDSRVTVGIRGLELLGDTVDLVGPVRGAEGDLRSAIMAKFSAPTEEQNEAYRKFLENLQWVCERYPAAYSRWNVKVSFPDQVSDVYEYLGWRNLKKLVDAGFAMYECYEDGETTGLFVEIRGLKGVEVL